MKTQGTSSAEMCGAQDITANCHRKFVTSYTWVFKLLLLMSRRRLHDQLFKEGLNTKSKPVVNDGSGERT